MGIDLSIDYLAVQNPLNVTVSAPVTKVIEITRGLPGPAGSDASVTRNNIISALGYAPIEDVPDTFQQYARVQGSWQTINGANAGNPFDQTLNTTSDVVFNSVSLQGGGAQINADGTASFAQNSIAGVTYINSDGNLYCNGIVTGYAGGSFSGNAISFNYDGSASFASGSAGFDSSGNLTAANFPQAIPVTSVAGKTGAVTLSNSDISGLGAFATLSTAPASLISGLATVATTGSYTNLTDKPSIPAAQVNSDWNASTGISSIANKPTIPSKTSQLTNDSGFLSSVPNSSVIGSVLTGLSTATNAVITASDSVLSAFGKLQAQVSGLASAGYQTAAQVTSAITSYGYQTASQVTTAITSYGYQTAAQVTSAITTALAWANISGKPTFGTSSSLDVAATGDASTSQVVKGNDTRLTNSRTPSAHALSHAYGGSDPLTLSTSQITGFSTAAAAAAPVQSVAGRTGTITLTNADVSGLGSMATVNDATSDGNQYARKNGAWVTVSGGGGSSVDLSNPGPIGNTTPNTGKFTNVSLTGSLSGTATGTVLTDGVDTLGGYGANTTTIASTGGVYLRGPLYAPTTSDSTTSTAVMTRALTDSVISGKYQVVSQAADSATISSSTTFANSPLAVSLSVGTWKIEYSVTVVASSTTVGAKLQATMTSGAATETAGDFLSQTAANTVQVSGVASFYGVAANKGLYLGNTVYGSSSGSIRVKGNSIISVSSAGTLTFQIANNTTGTGNVKLGAASYLIATKIA